MRSVAVSLALSGVSGLRSLMGNQVGFLSWGWFTESKSAGRVVQGNHPISVRRIDNLSDAIKV